MSVAVSAEIFATVSSATLPGFAVSECTIPRRGVSYVTKLLHLEPHPPRVNFIVVRALFKGTIQGHYSRALFKGRINLAELARVVRDLFEGGKNRGNTVYHISLIRHHGYHFVTLIVLVQLLFKGSIYFLGKLVAVFWGGSPCHHCLGYIIIT